MVILDNKKIHVRWHQVFLVYRHYKMQVRIKWEITSLPTYTPPDDF